MTIETRQVEIEGHHLHRLVLTPATDIRGGLVFFHGQGDFIDRYPPILEGFVRAGYQCLLTDLPGHGRSPGKRGHVPGLRFVDSLVAESLSHLSGPCVVAGHSMGGLMALRLLLREPGRFQAAWLSSPLLRIREKTSRALQLALPILARLAPRLTVSTGVKREQCRASPAGLEDPSDQDKEILYHDRISLSWGDQLCRIADAVWEHASDLANFKPILFTQGEDDEVCPAPVLAQLLQKLGTDHHQIQIIAGARHEPFSDSSRESLLAGLKDWIEEELTPTKTPLA